MLGLLAQLPVAGLAVQERSRAATPFDIRVESRSLEVNGKAAKVFGLTVDGKLGRFAHALRL